VSFPFQFGVPQIILLLIALCGFILFVYAAHSLLRGEKRYKHLNEYEKEEYRLYGRLPRRRRLRWQHGLGGVLLLFLSISLLWLTFLVQSYLGLTGNIPVAHVVATALSGQQHQMIVTLTLYDANGKPVKVTDSNGHSTTSLSYLIYGDEWTLEADFIKVAPWLNVAGVHSGYKVTRLEGRYDDINLEKNGPRSVYAINGGDDGFFQHMRSWQGWVTPFIDAEYGSATFTGLGSFNVYASQTGLFPEPANS
jgi:hypothetical protein